MLVDFEFDHDVCVLKMSGRFATGQDAEYLRRRTEELKRQGCKKIVADLSGVPYIDSTGIGFLIGIYTSIRREMGFFVLAGPNDKVREVLSLTKLMTILPTFDDVPAAVASLK
jgi:anti-sigma B factor antagonist